MRVLVTGSSAHLARPLLPLLCNDTRIDGVIGVDVAPPFFSHPRFTPVNLDVRSPALAAHLDGVDAVVHLAFVVMQGDLRRDRRNRALMRAINVAGSQNVFELAARARVGTLIHVSSAAVYALPARTSPINEDDTRRALPGFGYGEDKVTVEEWLDGFEARNAARVVRLRPHVILGPHAQPLLAALVRAPFHPRLPEPTPLTQCVHESDVAEAVRLALFTRAHGAFNLACADAASFRDIQRVVRPHSLPLPLAAVRLLFATAWAFGYGTDPGWLTGINHSLVLDCARARAQLGWRPRFDSIHRCVAALEMKHG
jgi:UDP-glucose 4-epimerase